MLGQAAEAFADLGGQEVTLERQYGSAPLAAGNVFPLDEELELLPGRLTPGLDEILVRLGSWMPFAQAQGFLVGGEWAEVKTVVIGEVDEVAAESGTLREISYFSRLTDASDFTRQALAETCRQGLDAWGQAALVSDGAEWIQGFGDFHCPGAVRILDFPHAAGYLAEIGRGYWRKALRWLMNGKGSRSTVSDMKAPVRYWRTCGSWLRARRLT